jgi:hypothetical protein
MAQQLTSTHRAHLRQATDIIEDVVTLPLTPMGRGALAHAHRLITDIINPAPAPAAAASQAPPPAAPVLTITEVDGPTPPIRAHAHGTAVKAAATHKANKQKSAGTGEKIGADTKAPETSDEPAVTE